MKTDLKSPRSEEGSEGNLLSKDGTLSKGALVRLKDLPGKKRATRVQVDRSLRLEFPVLRSFLRNLLLASVLAFAPGMLAIGFTTSLWLGTGVPSMQTARLATVSAEDAYHRTLLSSQPLLGELGTLGAPQDQLETIYHAFENAPADAQRELADTYLGVLIDQVNIANGNRGEAANRARQMLLPVIQARGQTHEAWNGWKGLMQTPKGGLIISLWMVAPPSPGMELYEKATVRTLLPPSPPSTR